MSYFQKAVKLNPHNFSALSDLILTLLGLQFTSEELSVVQELIERYLDFQVWSKLQRAKLLQFVGHLHYMLGGKDHECHAVSKLIEVRAIDRRGWDFDVRMSLCPSLR